MCHDENSTVEGGIIVECRDRRKQLEQGEQGQGYRPRDTEMADGEGGREQRP